jgi:hypothetical protein
MPRLNLDIFSSTPPNALARSKEEQPPSPVAVVPGPVASEGLSDIKKVPAESEHANTPSTRFVPVGLTPRHLALLRDVVYRLRSTGHVHASKSSIIRSLVDLHADELDRVWLDRKQ